MHKSMIATIRERTFDIALLLTLLLIATTILRKVQNMSIADPLQNTDLSGEEIQLFRYTFTLHSLSQFGTLPVITTAEAVRQYMRNKEIVQCAVCGRYFLDIVRFCPEHHLLLKTISRDMFCVQIAKWEAFQRQYSQVLHTRGVTRSTIIKLYTMLEHPDQR